MNSESILIDLLSKKKTISCHYYKSYARMLGLITFVAGSSALFFFVVASFIYRYFYQQTYDGITRQRLTTLFNFSKGIGLFICLGLLLVVMIITANMMFQSANFPRWLKKESKRLLDVAVSGQNPEYYFLSRNNQMFMIKKIDSQLVATSLSYQLRIGQRIAPLGLRFTTLFILNSEPVTVPTNPTTISTWNKSLLQAFSLVIVLGLVGSTVFMAQTPSQQELAEEFDYVSEPKNRTTSDLENKDGLVCQKGGPPTHAIDETNHLLLEENELYMTTDSGATWKFVPIKADWLRAGDYTLTSGTIPLGFWMDKTYDIGPDFSWFIYSSDSAGQSVYLLTSLDKGQTWQKNLIDNRLGPVRYRKATFFDDGSGVAVFSTTSISSEEFVRVFTTANYGKNWCESGGTLINQPVQNTSYLSPSMGFLATRNDLYYTHNAGGSFKKAIITIPDEYATNGLDIFQSPNEITAVSSTKLEAKFNLVKPSGVDRHKIVACLFQSLNGGESWCFVKQLSPIELND